MSITFLDVDGAAHDLDGDGLAVDAAALAAATGWELKTEGLCRGEVCVPLLGRDVAAGDGRIDLAGWAGALGLPFASDVDEGVAAVVDAPDAEAIRPGAPAPDVTLPDLDGQPVSFSRFTGRKRVLLAWASW
jgi:hypothetical protein